MILLECILANGVDNPVSCPTNHNVGIRGHYIGYVPLTPRLNPNNRLVKLQCGLDLKVDPLAIGNIHSRENYYAATI